MPFVKKTDRKLGVLGVVQQKQKATEMAKNSNKGPLGYHLPSGFSTKKIKVARIMATPAAQEMARVLMKENEIDDPLVEDAFVELALIMKMRVHKEDKKTGESELVHVYGPRERIAAASKILEFKKEKPTQRNDHTVRRAEDFLDQLIETEEGGDVPAIEHTGGDGGSET